MSTVSETPSLAPPTSSSGEILESLDDPDADIILRSREDHEFRVLKIYVTKVSPVLRDLIQSTSSSHTVDATPSLSSVKLSDGSSTLYSLLTFILPMLPVLPSTHEQTIVLLSTAQKYQMDSIMSRIRETVASQNPPFIRPETAFQIYSLARMHGLRQEALQAARTTLTFSFTLEDLEDELGAIPGIYLHELWMYYQSVRTHLRSDLTALRTTGMPVPTPSCGPNTSLGTPVWLDTYVRSIAESPALFDLTEFHMSLSLHISQRNSSCRCSSLPSKAIRAFWTDLTNVVHSCMTKAESAILPLDEPPTALCSSSSSEMKVPPTSFNPLNMSGADIIIQSCNHVNFRVHKQILAMSSPFFNDMFSLPQPQISDEETVDGLPVVRLSEDTEVLRGLISMLYPIPSGLPNSYDKALTLSATARKYDMVSVQSRIVAEIQSREFPPLTAAEILRSYAISSSGELSSERQKLARQTLDFPMTFEYLCDELPSFEGWALRDLVGFRKRCRDNLVSCFESFLKLDQPPFNIWTSCRESGYSYSPKDTPPSWLTQLFKKNLDQSRNAFTMPFFDPKSIRAEYLSALKAHILSSSSSCVSCPKIHTLNGEKFCGDLIKRLKEALISPL